MRYFLRVFKCVSTPFDFNTQFGYFCPKVLLVNISIEHQLLWTRLNNFELDDRSSRFSFTHKLVQEQKWKLSFAIRASHEYKRFIFLCSIADKSMCPSMCIDTVWHLHLLYTHSYWIDMCQNTLGKMIHHNPSKGGNEEEQKHQNMYIETLNFYQHVFNQTPPPDIWPMPSM